MRKGGRKAIVWGVGRRWDRVDGGYLDNVRVGVHQVQQQADQDVVDLVFEHRLPGAELGQVPQQHDGSASDLIVLLPEAGEVVLQGGGVERS